MNNVPDIARTSRRAAWIIATVLLLLPPILLEPSWRLWGLSALEDGLLYYFPQRAWFAQVLRSEGWPLWQHQTYGGFPVFADPQMAMYYPPTWLFLVLPAWLAYPLSISLHHTLAGWLTYRLCRALGRSRGASLVGALMYAMGAFMVCHREHLTMHHAAAWVPGVLWFWHRWAVSGRARDWMWAVLAVVAQILAGHVQVTLMTVPVALALVVHASPRRLRTALGCLAGLALSGLICSVQILPAMQLLAQSADRRDLNAISWNSLAWRSLMLWLFPLLLGQRTPNFYAVPWFGASHQCEQTCYVTVLGLALAVGAPVLLWDRNRTVRFWVWTGAVALILALGRNVGVYFILLVLPLFNVLHTPARWLMILQMVLAILAAFGADTLVGPPGSEDAARRVWLRRLPRGLAIACVLVLAWFAVAPSASVGRAIGALNPAIVFPLILTGASVAVLWLRVRWSATCGEASGPKPDRIANSGGSLWLGILKSNILLVVLVIADFATVVPFIDVSRRASDAITRSPAVELLRRAGYHPESGRVWVLPGDPYVRSRECMMPATNLMDNIATFNGYGPMLPTEHRLLMRFEPWGAIDDAADWASRSETLSRLGIEWLVVRDPNVPHERLCDTWNCMGQAGPDIRIYRCRRPVPLWFTTDRCRWVSSREHAARVLQTDQLPGGDPAEVVLESLSPISLPKGKASVLSSTMSSNRAEFEVESPQGTLLVWLNRWYPGWRASVDDRPQEVYRCNLVGQAVLVPPGRRRVIFSFEPSVLRWSIGLSLAGCAILLFTQLRAPRRHS